MIAAAPRRSHQPNPNRPISALSVAEIAYFAGIVDGEGCVTLRRSPAREGSPFRWHFYPHLSITNTNEPLLQWVVDRWPVGGSKVIDYGSPDVTRRRPVFLLTITGRCVRDVCAAIHPYCIVKRRHTELLATYPMPSDLWPGGRQPQNSWLRNGKGKGGRWARSPEMYAEQCRIFREIWILNGSKGPGGRIRAGADPLGGEG